MPTCAWTCRRAPDEVDVAQVDRRGCRSRARTRDRLPQPCADGGWDHRSRPAGERRPGRTRRRAAPAGSRARSGHGARPHHALTTSAPPTMASGHRGQHAEIDVPHPRRVEHPRRTPRARAARSRSSRRGATARRRATLAADRRVGRRRGGREHRRCRRHRQRVRLGHVEGEARGGPGSGGTGGRVGALAGGGGTSPSSRVRSQSTAAPSPISTSGQKMPSPRNEQPEAPADREQAERHEPVAEQLATVAAGRRRAARSRARRGAAASRARRRSPRGRRRRPTRRSRAAPPPRRSRARRPPRPPRPPAGARRGVAPAGAGARRRRTGVVGVGGSVPARSGVGSRIVSMDRSCAGRCAGAIGKPLTATPNHPRSSRGSPAYPSGAACDHRGRPPPGAARADRFEEPDVQHATGSPTTTRPPLARRSRRKLIAGVASGLGDHFHIEPTLVRLAFVVLTLAGGAGIVLYAGGWLFLPTEAGRDAVAASAPATTSCRCSRSGAITLGVLLFARSVGLGFGDALLWPVVLAAMGTALIVGPQRAPDRRADRRAGAARARTRRARDAEGRPTRRRCCASCSAVRWSSRASARSSPPRARSAPWVRVCSRSRSSSADSGWSSDRGCGGSGTRWWRNAANASGPTSAPRWPRTSTTPCSRRSR